MTKKKFLETIEVKTPCTESWDEMQGTDKVRFCSHCAHSVNNLSEITFKEAMKLVRRSEGRLCVRYHMDPATRRPLFADTLHQITRRVPRLAAGVMTASIALSAGAYAQTDGGAEPAAQILTEAKPAGTTSTISGYVTDPNGAALPYALVGLFNEQTSEYRVQNASGEGFYEFKDLPAGTYKVKIDASGFGAAEISAISVADGSEVRRDARLAVQQVEETVQVGGEAGDNNHAYVTVGGITTCEIPSGPVNALVEAVYNEDMDEVQLLVAKGHRVNSRDNNHEGVSALHAAVETGNIEIAQFLLSSGAKINGRDSLKRTPMMMMDYDATPELLQLLLRYGAKVNLVDRKKFTALNHFAGYDKPEIFRLLILAGADVNAVNKEGATPLMIAAQEGHLDIVKALLESGANVNPRKKSGEGALEMADKAEIKGLLESYGAIGKNR
jgi:ankyrin repeat protein